MHLLLSVMVEDSIACRPVVMCEPPWPLLLGSTRSSPLTESGYMYGIVRMTCNDGSHKSGCGNDLLRLCTLPKRCEEVRVGRSGGERHGERQRLDNLYSLIRLG